MNRKRPVLSPGDVCKISRKFQHRYKRNISVVVIEVEGDGSDRDSQIQCTLSIPSKSGRGGFKKPFRKRLRREHLWFTGYNINKGERPKTTLEQINAIQLPIQTNNKTKGPHTCNCLDWATNGCHCNGL